jgi:hypothetical protein
MTLAKLLADSRLRWLFRTFWHQLPFDSDILQAKKFAFSVNHLKTQKGQSTESFIVNRGSVFSDRYDFK